ncbi:hypothetical protein [Caulobacter sp. 17J65-9]|uniref:hypothetical protein n=1 Tax=Caulobacter sp. 17J65-9 TaxID=2709382 RepID=UPI0013CB2421|nr:hypothetical protein [Caulobacter sp. 17J65-9]NEX91920.1 hypothetical protein [Caulobacter sp. 17J65-9]
MVRSINTGVVLGAAFCMQLSLSGVAHAEGPAVSGLNGKIEAAAGAADGGGDTHYRVGGSVTLPLGRDWGLQADGSYQDYGQTAGAGAVHLFTRDPDRYLFGATVSGVQSDAATLGAIGAEGELYLGRFTLDGWAGYGSLDYDETVAPDKDGGFAMVGAGYYPTDDLRLGLGAASVFGADSVNFGAEYQFASLPLSFTFDARVDEDGEASGLAGLRFYFGGERKTLIQRHRQDDPRDRGFDLFAAAGRQALERPAVASDFTSQGACEAAGFTWTAEHCT